MPDCSSTCQTCNGPSFSDCLTCDESSSLRYFDQGLCNTRCGIFRYAPVGSFLCQSCDCNGHSTSCDDFGVCQNCNDNTEGAACDTCISMTFRTEDDLSLGCEGKLPFSFFSFPPYPCSISFFAL